MANIPRGSVWLAELEPVRGSEQGGSRPVAIISPEFINDRSPVVMVVPITSKKTERIYPFESLIEVGDGGLRLRSKAMPLHARSIDKARLSMQYGQLSPAATAALDEAIRIVTGLTEV